MYRFISFAGVVTLSLLGAVTHPGTASAQKGIPIRPQPGFRTGGAARPLPPPVVAQTPRPAPRPTPQIKTLPSVTPHPSHAPHRHGHHHGHWGHGHWHHGHGHHGHGHRGHGHWH